MLRLLLAVSLCALSLPAFADPLPSWADTEPKEAIIAFVETVTDPGSDDYVPPADRIAVFDNDGTLWAEQPLYFQLIYALERLREEADDDPSILTSDVLKAAAEGDMQTVAAGGTEGLMEILAVSHADISVEDFQEDVAAWAGRGPAPDNRQTLR